MADVKMMRLQGKDYLPVAERVWLFRQDHPDWGIVTEQVAGSREEGFATFRATIMDENGRIIGTAHKTEDLKGFGDFSEKAEAGAVGRALSYCGYGTLDVLRDAEMGGGKVVDSPQGGQQQAPQKMEPRPLKTPADNLLDVLHRLYDGDVPKGHPRKVYNALNGRTIDCKDEMNDAGFRRAVAEISKNYKTKADLEMVLVSAGAFGPLDLEPEIPAVVKEV